MIIQLEDIKNHIGINTNDDDDILTVYVEAVGEFLKTYLGTVIEKETVTEYFDGDDIDDTIFLSNLPVISITSFQYGGGAFSAGGYTTWTDFNAADYQYDLDKGIIYTNLNYAGIQNIKVVYDAGYEDDDDEADDIPKAIKLAAIKVVAKVYNKRRSDGFKNEAVAGASIEWDNFLSDDIVLLLSPHRKISL